MQIRAILRTPAKKLKSVYHRAGYNLAMVGGKRDALIPPGDLHSVGDSDFVTTGDEFFRHFIDVADLQPHESVLDIGCGTGRMARPLATYMSRDGSYDGIDIVAGSIDWCNRVYRKRFPHFKFHFLDAYNGAYNPAGKTSAREYDFPFPDSTFDFAFLTSVFTHMLPEDMDNYVSEISRMLKPGGRCLITYFLLTADSLDCMEKGLADRTFPYEVSGCRVQIEQCPEEAVAYGENQIREFYRRHGLQVVEPIRYGSWCGRENGLSYQDVVLAKKVVDIATNTVTE